MTPSICPTKWAPDADAPVDPSVLVAVVNYRTARLVVEGLAALEQERASYGGQLRVIVVDNDSGDTSADIIDAVILERGWQSWVELVRAPLNGGFSYGNNLAIRRGWALWGAAHFVWLVNPDACVRPGALGALVNCMVRNRQVGLCGSCLEDQEGVTWRTAFRFPNVLGELEASVRLGLVTKLLKGHTIARPMSDAEEAVDWVAGASLMIRSDVFDTIGLMDEGYFLYFEETDFCLAARRAGWECWYVPSSRVMHLAGQSTGVTGAQAGLKRLPDYWFESRRRYFVKNHGRLYAGVADAVSILAFSLWRLRRWLQRRPDTDPPHQLWDMLRHSALFHVDLPGNTRLRSVPSQRV